MKPRNIRRTTHVITLCFVLCLAWQSRAAAQIATATVAGSVTDTQGLVIPGATVTLVSVSRGTSIEGLTNESGDFVFPNVPGDTYVVRVAMDGFKRLERSGIAVSPGSRVTVPVLIIEVGALNETVLVTGEAPVIQAQSGERSFTITTEAVENLPVANRAFSALTALTPGVLGTDRLGSGGQNNVTQDGVSTMDTGSNGANGMLQLNTDAIAEVRILTQAYQAEYGRSSGLQISAVSKSGTNQFRGSMYDIERNSAWNSNSWVNSKNGDPKAVLRERDWGYTVGGPIGKPGGSNKLFFFYSHEYRPRTMGGAISRFRVPTALERQGDFSQTTDQNGNLFNLIRDASTNLPCTAANTSGCFRDGGVLGRIPQDRLYQTGLNVLKLWPMPNTSGLNYNLEIPRPITENLIQQPLVRVDYLASSKLRIFAKYASQRQRVFLQPGTIPGFNDILNKHPFIHHAATTVDYTITPTMYFEATYGFVQNRLAGGGAGGILMTPVSNRNNAGLGNLPLLYPDAGLVNPDYYAFSTLESYDTPYFVDGRIMLPPAFTWGSRIANAPPSLLFPGFLNINRTQDFSASVTKLAGRHTLKAGFYLNHSYKAENIGGGGSPITNNGDISFADDSNNPLDAGFGFANAALGVFSAYSQLSKMVEGNYLYNNIEWYVQDNWKVNSRLTLDYGLRFVHQQPQYDGFMQTSNFLPETWNPGAAPLLYTAGCPNNVTPCAAAARQAKNPVTGALLGPNTALAIGTLVPNSGNVLNGVHAAGDGIAKEAYVWPTLALAPRFGFAYDVKGTQSFVVRGGAGLFFDRPEGNSMFNMIGNPPHSTGTILRYAQLQTLGSGGLATQTPPQMFTFWYESDLPTSLQWNAGAQFALPWSSAFDVAYVGQRGYNLIRSAEGTPTNDLNAADFGAAYLPQNQDPTRAPSTVPGANANSDDLLRPYRGLGQLTTTWGRANNTYHSIQTSFNRRFRDGIQLGVNYTLGMSYTGNVIPTAQGTAVRLQHAADGSFSIRDDQDQYEELMENQGLRRHVLKASFVWDLPDVSTSNRWNVVGMVANDWQLSGIFTAGSGAPYHITYAYQTGGANVNITGSPNYVGRVRITGDPGSGCSSDQYSQFNGTAFAGPTYGSLGLESGRNYLIGCGDKTLDLAVARNFRLGGARNLQLRLDVFNVLDTAVLNARVTQLQLTTPDAQVIRNPQYLPDGSVDPTRLVPRTAGFGAATGAQTMRSMQLQIRFQF